MLKGIAPIIRTDLLVILNDMGHGDEILISDAHFPAFTYNQNVIRSDVKDISTLLRALKPLFEFDSYVKNPVIMMKAVKGDTLDADVEINYLKALAPDIDKKHIGRLDRFAFYERVKNAFGVVITGDTRKYGNIILKKGVTPLI